MDKKINGYKSCEKSRLNNWIFQLKCSIIFTKNISLSSRLEHGVLCNFHCLLPEYPGWKWNQMWVEIKSFVFYFKLDCNKRNWSLVECWDVDNWTIFKTPETRSSCPRWWMRVWWWDATRRSPATSPTARGSRWQNYPDHQHLDTKLRHQVAWVRVDTQTVLTMSEHVITKNHRIRVSEPDSNVWRLEISDIRRTDAGHYMCQINTDPMQSQLAYLDVMGEYCNETARRTFHSFRASVNFTRRDGDQPRPDGGGGRGRDAGLQARGSPPAQGQLEARGRPQDPRLWLGWDDQRWQVQWSLSGEMQPVWCDPVWPVPVLPWGHCPGVPTPQLWLCHCHIIPGKTSRYSVIMKYCQGVTWTWWWTSSWSAWPAWPGETPGPISASPVTGCRLPCPGGSCWRSWWPLWSASRRSSSPPRSALTWGWAAVWRPTLTPSCPGQTTTGPSPRVRYHFLVVFQVRSVSR